MKIYTKKGDDGTTGLIGGKRVMKYDERVEAFGTVDELLSYFGVCYDLITSDSKSFLIKIQNDLFTIGSYLANESDKVKLPELNVNHIVEMEDLIDSMTEEIPVMTHFILPGGFLPSSHLQLARTVCRRAERRAISLKDFKNKELVVKYLNRLSDYLFVLARFENHLNNIEEIKWLPDKS